MPTTNPPEQDAPPRPTEATTVAEFGRALWTLRRKWANLTQKELEDAHPTLTDSTISDHERGVRLPRLEWLYAYVTACLQHRHPDATPEDLNAEFHYWRAAWTRIEHAPTAPAAPVPRATTPEIPPNASQPATVTTDASTAPAPQDAPAATTDGPEPRRVRLPRRRVLAGAGVGVLVVAATITTVSTGTFDHTPDPASAQATGTTTPTTPIHASGQVENLRGVEGIDLDTNGRADQEAPGVDISPAATATHLNAMANKVVFTVLPEPGTETRDRCVKAVDWMRQIPNIYDLTEGRNICVITDEGRFSMLTITKRSSAATPVMNFHYTTWP